MIMRNPILFALVHQLDRNIIFKDRVFKIFDSVFFDRSFEYNTLVVSLAILAFSGCSVEHGLPDIRVPFMLFVFVSVDYSCFHMYSVC